MEVEIGRGKKGRRAYGFDDIAIVPFAAHPRPRRHRHHVDPRALPVRAAAARLGDGRRRLAAHRGHRRQSRRTGRPQPRGRLHALRGRGGHARAHRSAPARAGDRGDAAHLPGARQGRARRPAHPRDQGSGRRLCRLADAAARHAVLRDRARRGARHPRHPGHGHLGRARLGEVRAAQPQGVHPRGPGAGRGRRLCVLLHRPSPHAHGRCRRPGRRRPGRRVHHARRARHRRAPGDGDRRRPGRALAAHARDRRVRQRDRRRRHAQRRGRLQGDRLRRGRRDDRVAAGARLRGAGPRLPLGHGHVPPDAPARRSREDDAERHARADPARPRARERRHVQPDGQPADVDGHVRLRGHPLVPPRRGHGRAGAPDRGQAPPARPGGRHGGDRSGGRGAVDRRRHRRQRRRPGRAGHGHRPRPRSSASS